MISLSTSWSPRKRPSLAKVFAAGQKIGFRSFELGVSPAPFDLKAVLGAIERDGITISSIHAVCSEREVPPANRRGDFIAEPDEARRRDGVALVKETIDIARQVNAPAVVLHCGVLPLLDARIVQRALCRLAANTAEPLHDPPELRPLVELRRRVAPPYLDALEASLKELTEYAPDLLLGLENRYYIGELPYGDEFQRMFDRVAAPNLRYWHDVGHAYVLDRIGFIDHLGLLERYAGRLAGIHLHDIRGCEDHRPPGTGDFDFGLLARHLRPDVIRVMEIAAEHSAKAVRRGREYLAQVWQVA